MKKDKTGKKASANKRTGTLPPIKRRGPFEDAHGGNANHILDGSEADMTDESHNTSLDMSRSLDMSTSKRGKDQWWDSNAPANSQPFIRSFGRSGNLESSLRAARGETAIAPPPLPGIQPHPASVPSATVGETPLRVQHAPAQEKTSRKDKARKKKQPSHQLP